MFINPPGDHAARLIEAAGLKGFRIGDASVSEKHANFIINHGVCAGRRHRGADIARAEDRRRAAAASNCTPKCASSESRHEPAGDGISLLGKRDARAGSAKEFGKTAVLLGGDSSEREISLLSGNAVLGGLAAPRRRCACVRSFGSARCRRCAARASSGRGLRCTAPAARTAPCRARWNGSACPTPAAACSPRRSPWTSSRPSAWWSAPATPRRSTRCCRSAADLAPALERIGLPMMVKPASQGSSVGMTKVKAAAELQARLRRGAGDRPGGVRRDLRQRR